MHPYFHPAIPLISLLSLTLLQIVLAGFGFTGDNTIGEFVKNTPGLVLLQHYGRSPTGQPSGVSVDWGTPSYIEGIAPRQLLVHPRGLHG